MNLEKLMPILVVAIAAGVAYMLFWKDKKATATTPGA